MGVDRLLLDRTTLMISSTIKRDRPQPDKH